MNEHFVIAYVNDAKRTFTLTARKLGARLPEVMLQTERLGYRPVVVATQLDKPVADEMKSAIRSAYEGAGYTYQSR
jgi:hypothetical protein